MIAASAAMSSELDGILQCGRLIPGTVLGVFRNADRDGNGIVSGNEAVEFFSSTGVDKKHLKAVWDLATEKQPGGLTPAQFSRALRLISLLQTGCQLTDDFVAKALDPQTGLRLPQPRMGPQYLGAAPATVRPPRVLTCTPSRAACCSSHARLW